MMIEMECGHWLDYDKWLEREKDHKIEKRLLELEVAALKNKLEAIKEVLETTKSRSLMMSSLAQQQAMRLSELAASRIINPASGYTGFLGRPYDY